MPYWFPPPKKEVPQHFFYPQNSLSLGRKKTNLWARNGWWSPTSRWYLSSFWCMSWNSSGAKFSVSKRTMGTGMEGHPEYSFRDFEFFCENRNYHGLFVGWFFGTGKYADTSSNNCVSGVLTRVFSMCFPGFDLKWHKKTWKDQAVWFGSCSWNSGAFTTLVIGRVEIRIHKSVFFAWENLRNVIAS